jgi:alkaline phosphatase isozyme conversion protein
MSVKFFPRERTPYVFRVVPPPASLALGAGFVFSAPAFSALGETANTQARHIATVPGRMTGSPAEMLSADYLRQQFAQMGYQSDVRSFNTRYIYTDTDKRKNWQNVTGSTVIAAHEGRLASRSLSWRTSIPMRP